MELETERKKKFQDLTNREKFEIEEEERKKKEEEEEKFDIGAYLSKSKTTSKRPSKKGKVLKRNSFTSNGQKVANPSKTGERDVARRNTV